MNAVANQMLCSCGGHIEERLKDKKWADALGKKYVIYNAPTYCCDECEDAMYVGDVQIYVSLAADRMRKGELPNEVEYRNLFKENQ